MESRLVSLFEVSKIWEVSKILWACGQDMFVNQGLSHWKNSLFKTFLIVIYSKMKYRSKIVGILNDSDDMVATYMYDVKESMLHFTKFAVHPKYAGKGVGGYCLKLMEDESRRLNLKALSCEVFDKSFHAITFYENKGFKRVGKVNTLKYTEQKLIKPL